MLYFLIAVLSFGIFAGLSDGLRRLKEAARYSQVKGWGLVLLLLFALCCLHVANPVPWWGFGATFALWVWFSVRFREQQPGMFQRMKSAEFVFAATLMLMLIHTDANNWSLLLRGSPYSIDGMWWKTLATLSALMFGIITGTVIAVVRIAYMIESRRKKREQAG